MSKIAVLFPGIGYNCHKPLLYYSRKIAIEQEYEVIQVEYNNLPENVKGNADKMKLAYEMAYKQAVEQLDGRQWDTYDEVLFISKSIGTVVAAQYTTQHAKAARNVYLTPVEWTFDYLSNRDCIFIHGTNDPWAETKEIKQICNDKKLELICVDDGNHSLEVGNVKQDIQVLESVMMRIVEYIKKNS